MNDLLTRAGALFVAPVAAPRVQPLAAPGAADLVAVLAPADVLLAVAGGVAAGLRHAHRARAALVLLPDAFAVRQPGLPAAQALARRLAERDLTAFAAGATVRVGLPADGEAVAWRAITAAGVPTVIALAGRSDAGDALLARADELLLAPAADAALTSLALGSLAALGPPAALVDPPRGAVARRLAALGLTRLAARPHEVPA